MKKKNKETEDSSSPDVTIASKVKQLHIESKKLVDNFFAGNYRSIFRGPGLEFDEVREYVNGDDVRFIDWNVSSRMEDLYTKTFREEREIVLQFVIDTSASLSFGGGSMSKLDVAGQIFSLLALAAVNNNDKVGSILFSEDIDMKIKPNKGRKHVLNQISAVLSAVPKGKGSNLARALRLTAETMKRRGICVIISDFRTTGYSNELLVLARKHDVIAIRIVDQYEKEFPPIGLSYLQDPESSDTMSAFGRSEKFGKQYREYWEMERLKWRDLCRRSGVHTLEISTDDKIAEKIIQFFEWRKKK